MQVGDNEKLCFHIFANGFAQAVYEHKEAGGGGNGHQIVMERHNDNVRVYEHRHQSVRLQAAGGIHQHDIQALVIVHFLYKGNNRFLVVGLV